MAIYLRHLKPDGVMAFHVTNHFLNLAPVVKQIADANGLGSALIADTGKRTSSSSRIGCW
jgi:hypothetical protein